MKLNAGADAGVDAAAALDAAGLKLNAGVDAAALDGGGAKPNAGVGATAGAAAPKPNEVTGVEAGADFTGSVEPAFAG